jgi:hypothetical protein
MTDVAQPAIAAAEIAPAAAAAPAAALPAPAAAVPFPELVYAHFRWRGAVEAGGDSVAAEETYRRTLAAFEAAHGAIVNAYWCSEVESAAALTEHSGRLRPGGLAFHRVSDWATKGQPDVATELHRCDDVAVKASSILGGVRQRICMQLVMASAGHLLSLVDARAAHEDEEKTAVALAEERRRIDEVEAYYADSANGQAQIVYFLAIAIVGAILAAGSLVLWLTTSAHRELLGCLVAGALGAAISVMQRINQRQFELEYDVGRPYVFFLGGLRPVIGAVFGLAIYFAVASGVVKLPFSNSPNSTAQFYELLVVAFFAGFSERWAQDTLASAIPTAGSKQPPPTPARRV